MTKSKERQKRRKFTDEFKQDAVRMVLSEGVPLKKAAENLGIDRSNLGRWKKEHLEAFGGLSNGLEGSITPKEMDVEIRDLR